MLGLCACFCHICDTVPCSQSREHLHNFVCSAPFSGEKVALFCSQNLPRAHFPRRVLLSLRRKSPPLLPSLEALAAIGVGIRPRDSQPISQVLKGKTEALKRHYATKSSPGCDRSAVECATVAALWIMTFTAILGVKLVARCTCEV